LEKNVEKFQKHKNNQLSDVQNTTLQVAKYQIKYLYGENLICLGPESNTAANLPDASHSMGSLTSDLTGADLRLERCSICNTRARAARLFNFSAN
jgi:hypothetical protein